MQRKETAVCFVCLCVRVFGSRSGFRSCVVHFVFVFALVFVFVFALEVMLVF